MCVTALAVDAGRRAAAAEPAEDTAAVPAAAAVWRRSRSSGQAAPRGGVRPVRTHGGRAAGYGAPLPYALLSGLRYARYPYYGSRGYYGYRGYYPYGRITAIRGFWFSVGVGYGFGYPYYGGYRATDTHIRTVIPATPPIPPTAPRSSCRAGRAYGGVRIQGAPHNAEVYVDGNYAGVVDDYDGTFQRLDLETRIAHGRNPQRRPTDDLRRERDAGADGHDSRERALNSGN